MTNIHFIYGRTKDNASKAARLYHAAYSNHRQPNRRKFSKIHLSGVRPDRIGVQTKFSCGRLRFVRTPAFEENILRTNEENQEYLVEKSPCKKDQAITVWNILHDQLLHPYYVQHVLSKLLSRFLCPGSSIS